MAGSPHPPTGLDWSGQLVAQGLIQEQTEEADAEMLLIATLRSRILIQPLLLRVSSLTLLRASRLPYQGPLGCQRVKVGSGANDKLLINLQEIKRNL